MKRWGLLLVLVAVLVAAGITVRWWLTPLLQFIGANTDVIQGLADALQMVFWGVAAITGLFAWWRRSKKPPAISAAPTPPPAMPSPAGHVQIDGSAKDSIIVTGDQNQVIRTETYVDKRIFGVPATANPEDLRKAYLNYLFESARQLSLAGVDPKAASDPLQAGRLDLDAVYTALLTQATEMPEPMPRVEMPEKETRRLSALAQLNRHSRLVLLGDPGSGKSTFVNFVALCLTGEALQNPTANLALLTAPLPPDKEDQKEKELAQPWNHRTLLPVRIILRDFAARGLPPAGQPVGANHLCQFIAAELEPHALHEYADHLQRELHENGGLLLLDGLDEVPESQQRRTQIKQAIEDFAASFPRCRLLVTSRTYAYQQQDWRLQNFSEAVLAPFSAGQIRRFVERWYAHIGALRGMHPNEAQGRAELLKRAIFNSDRLHALAERPLLLTLMASLHAWRGGSLPEKREELYADTVDLLLDWWERPKVVRDKTGKLQVEQPSLAEWLKVDRKKVLDLLSTLAYEAHSEQPELVGTADVPEGKLVTGLLHLSQNPEVNLNPALLMKHLSERAGLLLPRGVGVYTFPHRTFQEYLTACYLTDNEYPDKLAELARTDPNRWREVALLAAAKASRGSDFAVWALVDSLCYHAPTTPEAPMIEIWGAHLAGQALVESAKLTKVSERNQEKIALVQQWLVHILRRTDFPSTERVLAGDTLARVGDPRAEVMTVDQMEFCLVPAGPFWMGEEKELHRNEHLNYDYWMSRFPITNAQFTRFMQAGGYKTERYWPEAQAARYWQDGRVTNWEGDKWRTQPDDYGTPFNLPNHPVVGITWYEMLAFTRWLTEIGHERKWLSEKMKVVLPSEAEWEKAARGGEELLSSPVVIPFGKILAKHYISQSAQRNERPQRRYPWGDDPEPNRANYDATKIGATSAAGCFSSGISPYGCEETSGNVWEWTRSLWGKDVMKPEFRYPYDPADGREKLEAPKEILRVLRGGAFNGDDWSVRCAGRVRLNPNNRGGNGGFRVAVLPLLF